MDATGVGSVLRAFDEFGADRVFPDVLPFLGVAFSISQSVMKAAGLKCTRIRMAFRETVFPKSHPLFDGKFEIMRSAEEVDMVGHQQVIAYEPSGGGVFPDIMQRALDGRLREPRFAFFRADVEENPVWSAEGDVDAFRWRSATWITERGGGHSDLLTGKWHVEKKRVG